jgi:hypothetical protein
MKRYIFNEQNTVVVIEIAVYRLKPHSDEINSRTFPKAKITPPSAPNYQSLAFSWRLNCLVVSSDIFLKSSYALPALGMDRVPGEEDAIIVRLGIGEKCCLVGSTQKEPDLRTCWCPICGSCDRAEPHRSALTIKRLQKWKGE